jgi:hypothetical protein
VVDVNIGLVGLRKEGLVLEKRSIPIKDSGSQEMRRYCKECGVL